MEETARAPQTEGRRAELARATLFIGGMYCNKCTDVIRDRLSNVRGVIEVLVTNYIETTYGIAQVFYDSHQVSRDEFLAQLGTPYWATLIEDKDPQREEILLRHTDVYVC